jgi:hypothetical protein
MDAEKISVAVAQGATVGMSISGGLEFKLGQFKCEGCLRLIAERRLTFQGNEDWLNTLEACDI